jgi:hypothetical protein
VHPGNASAPSASAIFSAASSCAHSRTSVSLFFVPHCRPPRRSPGLEPRMAKLRFFSDVTQLAFEGYWTCFSPTLSSVGISITRKRNRFHFPPPLPKPRLLISASNWV